MGKVDEYKKILEKLEDWDNIFMMNPIFLVREQILSLQTLWLKWATLIVSGVISLMEQMKHHTVLHLSSFRFVVSSD